jgi:hypothetical protein
MIKNNLFGQILIGLLVFFLLFSSAQMFGWGVGIDAVEEGEVGVSSIPSLPKVVQENNNISPDDRKKMKEVINAQPMFSNNRTPFVEEVEVPTGEDDEGPIPELKAQLTGVVITPTQSYAMILDTLTNQRDTYKVGMPLQGEQGGWTLNTIQSRKVVFVSDDDKTEELELAVFNGDLNTTAGKSSKPQLVAKLTGGKDKAEDKKGSNPDNKKDNKKNADDIRKKIAERRAKMRADAAKKNK